MTARMRYYLDYLQSDHWRALRKEAFIRDGFQCQMCPRKDHLQGHHLRYRKNLYEGIVDDILTVCVVCHKKIHGKKTSRKERRARRQQKLLAGKRPSWIRGAYGLWLWDNRHRHPNAWALYEADVHPGKPLTRGQRKLARRRKKAAERRPYADPLVRLVLEFNAEEMMMVS